MQNETISYNQPSGQTATTTYQYSVPRTNKSTSSKMKSPVTNGKIRLIAPKSTGTKGH